MKPRNKAARRLGEIFSLVRAVLLGRPDVSLDNRRQSQRLRLRIPVTAKLGIQEVKAELLDISPTGMRLRLPLRVEEDDTLRISSSQETGLVGRQRLVCRVAWVKAKKPEYEVGLEYHDSDENLAHSWIQLALRHLDPEQVKRRSRRIPAYLFVHVADAQSVDLGRGICVNISTGGCLLKMDRRLPLEQGVRLGLGPGDQEPSIFLTGKILNHVPSNERGEYLHHVQFYPGENRNHQRLRSLMLTLLEELENEVDFEDEPEIALEDEDAEVPSIFVRMSQPVANPVVAEPKTKSNPPVKANGPAVEVKPAVPADDKLNLSERLGKPAAIQKTRGHANRSASIWAARNLPVSSRPKPRDGRKLPEEPNRLPESDADFC